MRHRTIGLAAVVLLAAPVVASCTRPPGGGGGTTTTTPSGGGGAIPGPSAGQENCGTIKAPTPNATAASCFLKYHTVVASEYLRIDDGANTIVLQATGHAVTVTRAVNGVVTKTTKCSGVPNSQFNVTATGQVQKILGNMCDF
jgi:hypothetical protein